MDNYASNTCWLNRCNREFAAKQRVGAFPDAAGPRVLETAKREKGVTQTKYIYLSSKVRSE